MVYISLNFWYVLRLVDLAKGENVTDEQPDCIALPKTSDTKIPRMSETDKKSVRWDHEREKKACARGKYCIPRGNIFHIEFS